MTDKNILLKSIRVIDPSSNFDQISDIEVKGEKIFSLKKSNSSKLNKFNNSITFDCNNLILCSGIVDTRVHLNGPTEENISKIQSIAAKSGVLKLVTLPNQNPVIDDATVVEYLYEKSKNKFMPEIFTYGCATKQFNGTEITELGLMSEAGVLGFTDGVHCIQDSLVMRRVMSYASMLKKPVIQHAEDRSLAGLNKSTMTTIEGEMNESEISTRLGLVGIPSCAEVIIIERDLRIAKLTNAHYHVSNVSTKESIKAIRKAKEQGLSVTCDTSPAYFYLNELELSSYNTAFKLSPPLRSEADRLAIIDGIKDDTIDIITSDHHPRSKDTKILPFSSASTGAAGLETLLSMTLGLVNQGYIDISKAIKLITTNPSKIFKIEYPKISKGSLASFIIFDPEKPYFINQEKLLSYPTPFNNRPVEGMNLASFIKGKIIYMHDDFRELKNE